MCVTPFRSKTIIKKLTICKTTVNAEVADTLPKKLKGLMFRESLTEGNGMLFLFYNDDYHGIWMMNMRFPLDIIWIDSNQKIVDIVKNAQPCIIPFSIYKPRKKARYVLEVNAGFTDKHSIKVGDIVKF